MRKPERDRMTQELFRRAVLKRDGNRCRALLPDGRRCPRAVGLVAHHIVGKAAGGSDDVTNGVTLCGPHHRAVDRHAR
jgi:predicted restriction endonuclease